jgi:hypothetical protein
VGAVGVGIVHVRMTGFGFCLRVEMGEVVCLDEIVDVAGVDLGESFQVLEGRLAPGR